jgi:hypothetical protein
MTVFVVSRYKEDIEWTKKLNNVIIYNKGEYIEGIENQVMLENVGREGHTYYKYIYDNYNNLPEHIIFLQGNPFDHSPNLLRILNKIDASNDFTFLSQILFITDLDVQESYYHQCSGIKNTYKRIFSVEPSGNLFFGAGAQFIVSKRIILKHSKEYYKNIINILEYDINPIEGHHIERFHYHIFMGAKMDEMSFHRLMEWMEHVLAFKINYFIG